MRQTVPNQVGGAESRWLALVIERRRAERERLEALLAAEALGKRLQIITDAVPVLIAYVDRQERHRFASKAFQNWFGISPEQMLGKSLRELVGEAVYEAIRPHVAKALSGEEVTFDIHGGLGSTPTPLATSDLRAATKSQRRGGWLRRPGPRRLGAEAG